MESQWHDPRWKQHYRDQVDNHARQLWNEMALRERHEVLTWNRLALESKAMDAKFLRDKGRAGENPTDMQVGMQAVRNKGGADTDPPFHEDEDDDDDDDILILDPEESDACGDLGNDQDDASTSFTPAQSDLIQKVRALLTLTRERLIRSAA
ncbi:MAG: hypothetical protein IPG42_12060 [Betaproteobacteria bacterium]|nr:hypothetical protein [Betaproteobacteria bacterium]